MPDLTGHELGCHRLLAHSRLELLKGHPLGSQEFLSDLNSEEI